MLKRLASKRSVVNDLILWLSVSLGIIVIVLGTLLIVMYSVQAREELIQKSKVHTQELAKVLPNPMWNLDRTSVRQIADAYLHGERIAGVRVLDAGKSSRGKEERTIYEKGELDSPAILQKKAQILKEGRPLGEVQVSFSLESLRNTRAIISRTVLFLMAAVIAVIYVLTRIIMRRILYARIQELIQGIRDIAGGNYQKRLDPVPQQDLNAVNAEINNMAKQIEARENSLAKEIAERKAAEEALDNSEKRYRGIFENSLDGIFQISPRGEPLNINPAMASILGFPSVQEFMRDIDNIIDLFVDKGQGREFLSAILEKGRVHNMECRLHKQDATCIWLQIQAQAVRGKEESIEYLEGFAKDVTVRKLAEEELREVNRNLESRVSERTKELEQANRDLIRAKEKADDAVQAKSRFLANMSHEIRTPMNGVITSVDLALQEDLSDRARRYLSIIKNSGEQLLGIVNDILDFSKIDAGQMLLEKHKFELREIIQATVTSFVHKASEKGVELLIDIDPYIPLDLYGDSLRIRQVLANFLSNALKFTDNSGVVTLTVRIPEQGEGLSLEEGNIFEFAVSDTGRGMSQEEQNGLFQPFSQADASTTRKYGGTGLGLAISKQLVELMQGEIGVKSSPGRGSRFYFRVPLQAQSSARSLEEDIPRTLKAHRVLLVDDCKETNHLMYKILRNCGLEPKSYTSPEQALRALRGPSHPCDFDLVITDYKMPGMDGLEFTQNLRGICGKEKPVVLISAYENELTRDDLQDVGVDVFLAKPLNQSLIVDTLNKLVSTDAAHSDPGEGISGEREMDAYMNRISGLRVLVAEDNPINQEIARDILENAGMECVLAEDGIQAVELVKGQQFDVMLMDVQMPEMDGFEATYRIQDELGEKAPPILAMTAHALKGDADRCLKAGMTGYVSKPIKQEVLYREIFKAVQRWSGVEESDPGGGSPEEDARKEKAEADAVLGEVVDMQAALQDLGVGEEAFYRVLRKFRDKYQDVLDEFRTLANQGEWTAFHDLAHSLKGSAGQLRINSVQEAAYALELATKESPIQDSEVDMSMQELEKAIEEMVRGLQGI